MNIIYVKDFAEVSQAADKILVMIFPTVKLTF